MSKIHNIVATTNWISVLGGVESNIEAMFDFDGKHVTVSPDTLEEMAKAVLDAAIVSQTDAIAQAGALLSITPNAGGEYDVTEAGGGWSHWTDNLDLPNLYYDHDGDYTTDPRCELGLCVVCNDDALARLESPNPALSVTRREYVTSQEYRDRVHAAFKALGVTYRED